MPLNTKTSLFPLFGILSVNSVFSSCDEFLNVRKINISVMFFFVSLKIKEIISKMLTKKQFLWITVFAGSPLSKRLLNQWGLTYLRIIYILGLFSTESINIWTTPPVSVMVVEVMLSCNFTWVTVSQPLLPTQGEISLHLFHYVKRLNIKELWSPCFKLTHQT